MKARIYSTFYSIIDGNFGTLMCGLEDITLEETLKQNSIPFTKEISDEKYRNEFDDYFYYININNLEELIGLHRIFREKLIIEENGEELLIEIYNNYRE